VVINALLDDQIPASPGVQTGWTAIPRSVEWVRNTARKADTALVELDMRDFPLDPRMVKDILVTIHVADALDPNLPLVPTALNKRFVGLVDRPQADLSDGGEIVRLEARDYTGIWLDTKLSSVPPISLMAPLAAIVDQLRIRITPLIAPAVFTDPRAAAFIPGTSKGKTQLTIGKGESAWDVLSKLCQLQGLIPVFSLDVLEIRSATRAAVIRRRLVYGQNVTRLMFRRSLTREPKSRRITIYAWDPVAGVPVVGFYQPPNVRIKLNERGIQTTKITDISYNIIGAYTPDELAIIAKRIWDEQAGQELEGELETRELVDGAAPLGLSLLDLANGDTLDIRLGRDLQSSIEGMSPPEAIAFLSNPTRPNSLNPVAAQALVTAWTTAGQLAVSFYVREVSHTWHREDGYTMRASFNNFLLGQGL